MQFPPICFYIHPKFWPKSVIPSSPDDAWSGFNFGVYTWTIQTYLRLRRAGVDCTLTSELPGEGIILAHRECMTVDGERLLPGRRTLLVNLAADLNLYPSANIQIVQNPMQATWYRNCVYVTHWPEPGLVPRPAFATDRFENIAFFGNEKSLAPELRSGHWEATLAGLGLKWLRKTGVFQYDRPELYRNESVWGDYSSIDAVVAVRRFMPHNGWAFAHKPPTKLINAWLAGIPGVLGCESAFLHLRRTELDYVDVHSQDELLSALTTLRDQPRLRDAMRRNGQARSPEICAAATEREWLRIIEQILVPSFHRWVSISRFPQVLATTGRSVVHTALRIRRKASALISN